MNNTRLYVDQLQTLASKYNAAFLNIFDSWASTQGWAEQYLQPDKLHFNGEGRQRADGGGASLLQAALRPFPPPPHSPPHALPPTHAPLPLPRSSHSSPPPAAGNLRLFEDVMAKIRSQIPSMDPANLPWQFPAMFDINKDDPAPAFSGLQQQGGWRRRQRMRARMAI
jgi:hypothetical protein